MNMMWEKGIYGWFDSCSRRSQRPCLKPTKQRLVVAQTVPHENGEASAHPCRLLSNDHQTACSHASHFFDYSVAFSDGGSGGGQCNSDSGDRRDLNFS